MDHLRSPGRRQFLGQCLSASLVLAAAGVTPGLTLGQPFSRQADKEGIQRLDFVHVADMHAAYNPDSAGSCPMARVRGYLQATRRANPFTLFTNSGDDYEKGSLAEQLSHGATTRQVVHALGYDVRTLGNHDFAWGLEELRRFCDDGRAAVLCANAKLPRRDHTAPGPADFVARRVGKLTIGFFGLTTRPYGCNNRQHDGPIYAEHPELVMDFDHLAIARRIIARHRRQVDLLVLVSHLGITDDEIIARKTEGIDIILGGHSHTVLSEPLRINNTTIIHAGSNGESFGHLSITCAVHSGTIRATSYRLVDNRPEAVGVSALPAADAAVAQDIAAILAPYMNEMEEVVGMVSQAQNRFDMASLAARAAVAVTSADAALIDPHTVWQEWPAGQLSRQDILDAFQVEREPVNTPGTSSLFLVRLTGAELLMAQRELADCAYCGPTRVDPRGSYLLAMQKNRLIGRPDLFYSSPFSPPQAAAELWQVVSHHAEEQWRHNLALDQRHADDGMVALSSPRANDHPAL